MRDGREVKVLRFAEPSEVAYLAAGKYIVDHTSILVAVWNGKPAAGKGGTGDVVHYAQSRGKEIIHLNPEERTVHRILQDSDSDSNVRG